MMEVDEKGSENDVPENDEKLQNEKVEEEETSLEHEFFKIEKEVMSMKDDALISIMSDEQQSFRTDMDLIESIPVSEWVEAQETIKDLQIKLDIVTEELNASELEKSKLKVQVEHAHEKLKERESNYHALAQEFKILKEMALDAEIRHTTEVQSLKEALDVQDIKYKDLLDIKEAFDMLSLELESSSRRLKKLDGDLLVTANKAWEFEELSKEQMKRADQESKKAMELENMLAAADAGAKKMEDRIFSLQEELKNLKDLVKGNQEMVEASSSSLDESIIEESLCTSKSRGHLLDGGRGFGAVFLEEHKTELSHSKAPGDLGAEKVYEYEELLKLARVNAVEMEERLLNMQTELQFCHSKIAENQQMKDELSNTVKELALVKEELEMSMKQVEELEGKLTYKGETITNLNKESLHKDSEELTQKEHILQAHLTDLEREQHANTSTFQAAEMKNIQEFKEGDYSEISFKKLENQIQDLQEKLSTVIKEKEFGKETSTDSCDNLQCFHDAHTSPEEKRALSEHKLKGDDLLLAQYLATNLQLENKLNFLEESHKKELRDTESELTAMKEELNMSKSQVMEWKQKLGDAELVIEGLKREVHLYKDSEDQAKMDQFKLRTQFSDLKKEYDLNLASMQDLEFKYLNELRGRETSEIGLKIPDKETLNLHEQLDGNVNEKVSQNELLVCDNVPRSWDAGDVFKENLGRSQEILMEIKLELSCVSTEKKDLDKKICSLIDLNQKCSELEKTAAERNFHFENLIRSLNDEKSEMEVQIREFDSKLRLLQKRNADLEEELNVAELKCSDREHEIKALQQKISDFEHSQESLNEEHERTLSNSLSQLSLVNEQFVASKNKIIELEQKLISKEAKIEDLGKELCLFMDSEQQYKMVLMDSQTQLSDMKEAFSVQVTNMQNLELKYNDELKAREATEVELKSLEKENLNLQAQLVEIGLEKQSLEALLVESAGNLQQANNSCSVLEVNLGLSEEKLKDVESVSSQLCSEKQDLEQKLASLVNLNKESSELAKSATQRNFELESLIKSSNDAEIEMKEHVREAESKLRTLQQRNAALEEHIYAVELKCSDREFEIQQFQSKILELEQKLESNNQTHVRELSDTFTHLNFIEEQLAASKNQVVELEQKSISEQEIIKELERKIVLYKDSEQQYKRIQLELQTQLSDLKVELNVKVIDMQDLEIKYMEESRVREATKENLKNLEKEILNLQEQLVEVCKEKESLKAVLVERDFYLQQAKDSCSALEEKLYLSEEKFKEIEFAFPKAFSGKNDLEQKLGPIANFNIEASELAKNATERSFELGGFIRSSSAAESEMNRLMSEADSNLRISLQRNAELEEQLNAAEQKYRDGEYKIEELLSKILEFEQKLGSLNVEHDSSVNDILAQLTLFKEQLVASTNQAIKREQKSISKEAAAEDLRKEVLYKDSELLSKKALLELENQLSDLKEELNVKAISVQDSEFKYIEESRLREATEKSLKSLEKEILYLQEQLLGVHKEKEYLEALLAERDFNLKQAKDLCGSLEGKMDLSEAKLKEMDLVLSKSLFEKQNLEEKLGSLVKLNKEASELTKSVTQRNFDLEDLLRSSNAAESDVKAQMRETESRLECLHQRNVELEDHLNTAELKCNDWQYEVEQLQKKILELEQKLCELEEMHKNEISDAMTKLMLLNKELDASKNQIMEWEQKSISQVCFMEELEREVSLYKDTKEQATRELLESQIQLSNLKMELNAKIGSLQDVELQYIEESKAREAMHISLKSTEKQILNLQLQLVDFGKEKEFLVAQLVELENNLHQSKDYCIVLQEKLDLSEEQLRARDLVLSQALLEKQNIEQKLSSLIHLNQESSELAKSATQRNFDLENLLRSSSLIETEAKEQMKETKSRLESLHLRNIELEEQLHITELKCSDREYEVKQLQKKISEFEQSMTNIEEAHRNAVNHMVSELTLVKEELDASKNLELELGQKSMSQVSTIEELVKEMSSYKDSEEQATKRISELQNLLTDLRNELDINVASLRNAELRYIDETKAREDTEVRLKCLEKEILNLQEQLVGISDEKVSLESLLVERNNNLEQSRNACSDLEEKLHLTSEKLKAMEMLLSQASSEKHDLEQKMGSFVDLYKESAELAKNATRRNFELEDLVRSSNAAESEVKAQMKEDEIKMKSLHRRNVEMEEQLDAANLKCSDKENEVKKLQMKISEFEQKLHFVEEEHTKALNSAMVELAFMKEELHISRNQVMEWQQKSETLEAIMKALRRDISAYKDAEENSTRELVELQTELSDLKKELDVKVAGLQDIELRYLDESSAREATNLSLQKLEKEHMSLRELLVSTSKEKEALEIKFVEHDQNLQKITHACSDLKEKLLHSEEKMKEKDSVLSQAFSEKLELEQKLSSLLELNKESSTLVKSATQRSFELEDLIRSSSVAESQAKEMLRQAELKLESAQLRLMELEEQLRSTEVKCSDREYEVEQLQKKTLEFEHLLRSLEKAHGMVLEELTSVKDEIGVSKHQVVEWEQKSISDEEIIEELRRKLGLCMDYEERSRKELLGLQTQFSDLEKEHHVNVTSLLDFKHKYSNELKVRKNAEDRVEVMQKEILILQDKLKEICSEKDSLESVLVEVNNRLQQTTVTCNIFEDKLSLSEEKVRDTNLSLTQTMSEKLELEHKLCLLEELNKKSSELTRTATQRNLDLEDLIRSSNTTESELRAQLRESEMKLSSLHQKNLELEEQISASELRLSDSDYEVEQLRDKVSELTSSVKHFEEEKELLSCQIQAYKDRLSELEESLSISTEKKMELEEQLKDLIEQCSYHENESSTSRRRSLELEDFVNVTHSKFKDAESKVEELVLQLESTMHQLQVTEDLKRVGEVRYKDMEVEVKQLQYVVTELSSELEAFRVRSASLEIALQDAAEKEKKLGDLLNIVTAEKEKLEMSLKTASEKLCETTNACEVVKFNLKSTNEKLQSVEKNLEDTEIRERVMSEELKSAKEKLHSQSIEVEQGAMKISELEMQYESLSKISESKFQNILSNLLEKDSQIEELSKDLAYTREQSSFHQDQFAEATKIITTLQEKLSEDSLARFSLENFVQQIKVQLEDTEIKFQQMLSDREMITASNHELTEDLERQRRKIDQLQEELGSLNIEKEKTADQLACHVKSLAELTEQHARGLELHLTTDSYAREMEVKLQEAVESLKVKDSEFKELNEKLIAIECLAKLHEDRALEAANIAETTRTELEDSLLKLRLLDEEFQRKLCQVELEKEILIGANMKQTQELDSSKNKLQELHAMLDKLMLEKEDVIAHLHSSRTTIEDLNQQLSLEGERFQLKLSPIIEENNFLNKILEETKEELNAVIVGLEERLKEEEARVGSLMVQLDNLRAELVIKTEMQARIEELEQQLVSLQIQYKHEMTHMKAEKEELWSKLEDTAYKLKEKNDIEGQLAHLQRELHFTHTAMAKQRDMEVHKEIEREVSLKKAYEELSTEQEEKLLLEKYVLEMEQKIQTAESKLNEKEMEMDKKVAALTLECSHVEAKAAELAKKVVALQNELHSANAIISNLNMEDNKKNLIFVSELNDKESKISELEKKVMDLHNEMQSANAKITMQNMEGDKNIISTQGVDDWENIVAELEKKVVNLHNELQIANAKITEQDIEGEKHMISTSDLNDRDDNILELENKVSSLQNELHTAYAKITMQEEEIKEAKGNAQVEMRSKDVVLETTTQSERKSKSKGSSEISLVSPTPVIAEPSLWESLKFVMGIAFFSVVFGVILGRRY